jgi:nucleoside-diphosphate-sugar epimerase
MTARLLVIGATGQIGRNILRRADDRSVVALARRPGLVGPAARTESLPFDLTADLPAPVGGWPAAAIATTPIWLLAPHFDGLVDRGVQRLVAFSTTSVFGKSATRNPHERAVVNRVVEAEALLRARADARAVALTILRPTLIYGEGQDRTIAAAARFIRRFGVYPVHGPATGLRQPVHADDLAAAALAVLDSDTTINRDYALGGGETLSYQDMIARIFAVLGKTTRIVRVPLLPGLLGVAGTLIPGSELTGDVARRMNADLDFDDGAAARDFGYAPRPFLAGGLPDLFGSGIQA